MFLLPLCGICLYNLIENEFLLIFDKKQSNNFTSAIHIIFTVSIYLINLYFKNEIFNNFLVLNSTGFFLNDILFIIKKRKCKIKDFVYLYHHSLTIIYIFNQPDNSNCMLIICWAEISNIPSHFVYYYINITNKNFFQIKINFFCEKAQLFLYSFIRIVFISYLSYNENYIEKNQFQSIVFIFTLPLVLLGWVYSYVLLKKNINNNNENKKHIK